MRYTILLLSILFICLGLFGCAEKVPKGAFCLAENNLEERQLQTRKFESNEEIKILNASAGVLQDLGFNVDEVERDLGVISCSKQRDATSAGQIAGAIFVALLTGAVVPVDDYQLIRASIVTWPLKDNKQVAVRVTFQRVVVNNRKEISLAETISNPELYQQFFEKLSQSVFLEAHQL